MGMGADDSSLEGQTKLIETRYLGGGASRARGMPAEAESRVEILTAKLLTNLDGSATNAGTGAANNAINAVLSRTANTTAGGTRRGDRDSS